MPLTIAYTHLFSLHLQVNTTIPVSSYLSIYCIYYQDYYYYNYYCYNYYCYTMAPTKTLTTDYSEWVWHLPMRDWQGLVKFQSMDIVLLPARERGIE